MRPTEQDFELLTQEEASLIYPEAVRLNKLVADKFGVDKHGFLWAWTGNNANLFYHWDGTRWEHYWFEY